MNENYSFLELNTGESAIVVGMLNPTIASMLDALFEKVTVADWNEVRLERSCNSLKRAKPVKLLFTPGNFPHLNDAFNLILLLWAKQYLGNPTGWIRNFTSALKSRGRLKIIDFADRMLLHEQELTYNFLDLTLKVCAAKGQSIYPVQDYSKEEEILLSKHLTHLRSRIFTDGDLLVSGAEWQNEISEFIEYCKSENILGKSPGNPELASEIETFIDKSSLFEPATPPFSLLSGISPNFESQIPQKDNLIGITSNDKEAEQEKSIQTFTDATLNENRDTPLPEIMDKMRLHGPERLKSYELLEIVLADHYFKDSDQLTRGLQNEKRKINYQYGKIARRIIGDYGSKAISNETSPGKLAEQLAISVELACRIAAIFALGRRIFQDPRKFPVIRDSKDAYNHLKEMSTLRKEHLRGLYLNFQNRLIHDEVISIGTLSRSVIHPREVFTPALEYAACSVIIAHNHPTGDHLPSENDITITRQLVQAGRIMGIELVDHIVIGADGYTSLKEEF